jgi:uncharacterized protein YndB with AHSA1/START domain
MSAKARLDLSDDRDMALVRVFNAPRALVWRAWTEPEQLAAWWGPRFFDAPVCELDLKPGGAYRIEMRGPDDVVYPMKGVFLEIVAQSRLVMSIDLSEHGEAWRAQFNHHRGDSRAPIAMIQTATFEDAGAGKTRLAVTLRFDNRSDRDAILKMGAEHGWGQSFVKLDALLARLLRKTA